MRALSLILFSAATGLWIYYSTTVAAADSSPPKKIEVRAGADELSAETLNNTAVDLARKGRQGDALAYLERARDFRPHDADIKANYDRQHARVTKQAWVRVLGPGTVLVILFGLFVLVRGSVRIVADSSRLARVRLRGDPWLTVTPDMKNAELTLRFSETVDRIVKRHPLTIVWSRNGKHMKSRPPVKADGRALNVKLDQDRLDRLRRHPGDWRGFLYLGKTPVGETAARVA